MLFAAQLLLLALLSHVLLFGKKVAVASAVLSLSFALIWYSFVGLVCVRLECFDLILPFVAAALPLILAALLKPKRFVTPASTHWDSGCLILLLLLAVGLYFFFPTYYMLGGRDHGIYLLFGGIMAKTGGLNLDLPFLEKLHQLYGNDIQLGYPAIYSEFGRGYAGATPKDLVPQFMHLFSVVVAFFYKSAGLEGAVRANPFLVLLLTLNVFILVRAITNRTFALLAAVLLLLNPAMLWAGRATFTEPFNILFWTLGANLFFCLDKEDQSVFPAAVTGMILGLAELNRIDAGLMSVMVFGAAAYLSRERRAGFRRQGLALVAGFLLSYSLGVADAYLHTRPYLEDLMKQGLAKLLYGTYGVAAAAAALLFVPGSWLRRLATPAFFLFALVSLAWLGYAYFLRPGPESGFAERSMLELSWYVPFALLLLSSLSYAFYPLFENRGRLFFYLLGPMLFLTFILYTHEPHISPDHFWASRRWLTYVIPLCVIFALITLEGLARLRSWRSLRVAKWGRYALATGLAAYCLALYVNYARPFLFVSQMRDYKEAYADAVKRIKEVYPESVLFTRDQNIASYLTYLFDIPTVMVQKSFIDKRKKRKTEPVPWLGASTAVADDIPEMDCDYLLLPFTRAEGARNEKPDALLHSKIDFTPRRTISKEPRRFCLPVKLSRYYGGPLLEEKGVLVNRGRTGTLQAGLLLAVEAGTYTATWMGSVGGCYEGSPYGGAQVVSRSKKQIFAREQVFCKRGNNLAQVSFELPEKVADLEFMFQVTAPVAVALKGVEVREQR